MSPASFRSRVVLTAAAAIAAALLAPQHAPAQTPPARPASEDNPRVAPGLVRWHPSSAKAQEAARRSGKPVLLFHLMGQLDRQFC
jgi:hypothetical protein